MAKTARQPHVFLSYAAVDESIAQQVASLLAESDMRVTGSHTMLPGANVSRELRKQLLESDAVVAVSVSDREGAPSVAFEVGAALAAEKPLFAIIVEPAGRLPAMLAEARVFTLSHIDQLIQQIRQLSNSAVAS